MIRNRSQIATILTFVIAAIFVFILVMINIGKVSEKKTVLDNACDAAGLSLASSLGSIANSIKVDQEWWGRDNETCEPNTDAWIGLIITIIAGIATIVTLGGASPLLIAAFALTTTWGAVHMAGAINKAYSDAGLVMEAQAKFKNLTAEQLLDEQAMQLPLFMAVDDASLVPDLYDSDRDGIKMAWQGGHLVGIPNADDIDKIPRFNHWYLQRINEIPRIGEYVDLFSKFMFTAPAQFEIEKDPDSGNAVNAYLLVDSNWRAVDWLKNDFKEFIHNYLWPYGYGTTYFLPLVHFEKEDITDEEDELDEMIKVMGGLEKQTKELYNQSKDQLIGGFESWMGTFYNKDHDGDWYSKINTWVNWIDKWIDVLNTRHSQVKQCLNKCKTRRYECCSTTPAGTCCSKDCQNWVCKGPPDVCDFIIPAIPPGGTGPVAPQPGLCQTNPILAILAGCWKCQYADGSSAMECVKWRDCCGTTTSCCQGCNWSNCKNNVKCNTPTGGRMRCCDSACHLRNGCNNTIIPPFVNKLKDLRDSLEDLRDDIEDIALDAKVAKNFKWRYKAIYVWKDVIKDGAGEVQETPAHMLFVELDKDNDLPTFRQWTKDWGFTICHGIKNAEGDFTITVGRYDEDFAKSGPLSNIWNFRFRYKPKSDQPSRVNLLRTIADRFQAHLDTGKSCDIDNLISESDYNKLRDLAWDHGIATKVKYHYGPGWTYKPSEIDTSEAKKRNEDIYIEKRIR